MIETPKPCPHEPLLLTECMTITPSLPEKTTSATYKGPVCRGDWSLGNNCKICERCIATQPAMTITQEALEKAIILALSTHSGQQDKGGKPYILHPLRVMQKMTDPACQIADVLHDVVEDGGVQRADIEAAFGTSVADAVDALTRRERETYMAFIERCARNTIASKVKMADLEDNMDIRRLGREPTADDARRQSKYAKARGRLAALQVKP